MANYLNQENVDFDFAGKRFAVVVSTYHKEITGNLLSGALQTLADHQVPDDRIDVVRVPGAWELALGTQTVLQRGGYDGIVALGAVIRGETTHDQYINRFVSQALGALSLEAAVPVGFGLLTCDNRDQAESRSGGSVGNKGQEATRAMLEMVALMDVLDLPE